MKIVTQDGERVLIVVPADLGPGVDIMIVDTNNRPIAEVITQNGLLRATAEYVVRVDGTDNTRRHG